MMKKRRSTKSKHTEDDDLCLDCDFGDAEYP